MSRPLLGIACCLRQDEEPVHGVIDRYVQAAALGTGADIVLLPALAGLAQPASLARKLDGLLLTGSPSNIGGDRYGRDDAPGPHDPARDASNLPLISAMISVGKPVFGICRGHQEINVAFGGTLHEVGESDLPGGGTMSHHAPADASLEAMFSHWHEVTLTHDGLLEKAFGTSRLRVNSAHYQAISRLGEGLSVEAVSADGTIEAISARPGTSLVLGAQWHPEWDAATNPASAAFFAMLGDSMKATSQSDHKILRTL